MKLVYVFLGLVLFGGLASAIRPGVTITLSPTSVVHKPSVQSGISYSIIWENGSVSSWVPNSTKVVSVVDGSRYQPINVSAVQVKELMNYHWKDSSSDCAQWAASHAKVDMLDILGLAKTFNEQPVYETHKPLDLQPITHMISFPCADDACNNFYLDTSVYWTNDKGSIVMMKRHNRVPYNFSIYHQDDIFCWDFSMNETINCDQTCYSDIWNMTVNCGIMACRGSGNSTVACD